MILKFPLALARFSGLLIYENHGRWYPLLTAFNILNLTTLVVPIGYFMILHVDSLDYFTSSLGAFSNMFVNLLKGCLFLSTTKSFSAMISNLESIAGDNRRSNYGLSTIADRETDVYSKKFIWVIYIAVVGITVAPFLAIVLEYLKTGSVVEGRRELPFQSA